MVILKFDTRFKFSHIVAVGVFGFLGSCSRFAISLIDSNTVESSFPWGTLFVNFIGCFLLAWVYQCWEHSRKLPIWFQVGFSTGFIGSFTTFSAFSVEWMKMVENQQWFFATFYSGLSLFGGFGAIVIGYELARKKGKSK